MPEIAPEGGFGLYVHWPFCQSKCPYCDFNSHVTATVDHPRWCSALVAEIHRYARLTPNRVLQTIFFGGGTPSLMSPSTVAAVIEAARSAWPCVNDMEISFEANPTSVEAGRFREFQQAGVNRVSMGIQALNDTDLRALGRLHSVADARAAFDIARNQFERVSFDLIYARQNQTLTDWKTELRSAIGMAVDHLSLYQLSIEAGTAFGDRHARGLLRGLPDDNRSADMFEATRDICGEAGLPGYETSNHAQPDAESKHNLIYWRYGDYVGVGPGAHGRLTVSGKKIATEALRQPGAWLAAVERSDGSVASQESLSQQDQSVEMLMMGLRLSEGISIARYTGLAGTPLNEKVVQDLIDDGMIHRDGDRLYTSPTGRALLNAILRQLLAN